MLLVSHAFAGVTPTTFIIFVIFMPKPQRIKSNSKVTKRDFWGLPQSNPKSNPESNFLTLKVIKIDIFGLRSCFRGYLWVTLGETPKVAF